MDPLWTHYLEDRERETKKASTRLDSNPRMPECPADALTTVPAIVQSCKFKSRWTRPRGSVWMTWRPGSSAIARWCRTSSFRPISTFSSRCPSNTLFSRFRDPKKWTSEFMTWQLMNCNFLLFWNKYQTTWVLVQVWKKNEVNLSISLILIDQLRGSEIIVKGLPIS